MCVVCLLEVCVVEISGLPISGCDLSGETVYTDQTGLPGVTQLLNSCTSSLLPSQSLGLRYSHRSVSDCLHGLGSEGC